MQRNDRSQASRTTAEQLETISSIGHALLSVQATQPFLDVCLPQSIKVNAGGLIGLEKTCEICLLCERVIDARLKTNKHLIPVSKETDDAFYIVVPSSPKEIGAAQEVQLVATV